jgi:hypothetical protein
VFLGAAFVPTWLVVVSWIALAIAVLCAAWILYDVYVRGYRQHMWIMEAVWPITALYFGPLALWAYYRWGRPMSHRWIEEHGEPKEKSLPPRWPWATATAGCTLGDIVGNPAVVFLLGWKIFGLYLFAKYVVNYVLAYVFGIAFQYYSIKPMQNLSVGEGIKAAIKADTLSLTAFRVGLYGWMAVMQLVLFPGETLHPNQATFWFLMQIGMILGFATAYPVNWWLIKRAIKEAM